MCCSEEIRTFNKYITTNFYVCYSMIKINIISVKFTDVTSQVAVSCLAHLLMKKCHHSDFNHK